MGDTIKIALLVIALWVPLSFAVALLVSHAARRLRALEWAQSTQHHGQRRAA